MIAVRKLLGLFVAIGWISGGVALPTSADAFYVTIGNTTISDGGAGDLEPGQNVIAFSLTDQRGAPGRFDVSGVAIQRFDATTDTLDVILTDVLLTITQVDPLFHYASAYIAFTSDSFDLGVGQFQTRLMLEGGAPPQNTASVYNRIRGDILSSGSPRFIMGEADAAARPGEGFSDTQTRTSPLLHPGFIDGNWGIQQVHEVDTRIFITNAVAEIGLACVVPPRRASRETVNPDISFCPEPPTLALLGAALGMSLLLTRRTGAARTSTAGERNHRC